MKLEDVTMEIRPRSDWEAVDAGLAMARRDFWRSWAAWWMAVWPVLLLIYPLREQPGWWAVIFFLVEADRLPDGGVSVKSKIVW